MGWSRPREDKRGRVRYTAYYRDLRGRTQVAGTYSSVKAADKAWQAAETRVAEGRQGDPRRGRQTFQTYVIKEWLPNHVIELTTRESYTGQIFKHIMPWFANMRMNEILPSHVREWVTELQKSGVTPTTIRTLKSILSGIFTTALNSQVTFLHPCKGVKTPTVPKKPFTIITPDQFDVLFKALPNADMQMLIETEIDSGLRWGELTELRVKDLDPATGILTVSRAVVQVNPKFHPEGERFLVKEYPKDREFRRFRLSPDVVTRLRRHIDTHGREAEDLLFEFHSPERTARLRLVPEPDELGLTTPNEKGHQYRHGTPSAYNAGKCRCEHCKASMARYRATRRATGKDKPRTPRQVHTDGHIPRRWFRDNVWLPALKRAGIDIKVSVQDLRHAHASWLLSGGADLQVVKERLGHGSIRTTEGYLHTLPDADTTALDALARVRSRPTSNNR